MRQDTDKPFRNFLARLRGHAGVCKFTIKCPNCEHDVNYTDTIIHEVLHVARSIVDSHIQIDLFGDKNQDMTLEEVTQSIAR